MRREEGGHGLMGKRREHFMSRNAEVAGVGGGIGSRWEVWRKARQGPHLFLHFEVPEAARGADWEVLFCRVEAMILLGQWERAEASLPADQERARLTPCFRMMENYLRAHLCREKEQWAECLDRCEAARTGWDIQSMPDSLQWRVLFHGLRASALAGLGKEEEAAGEILASLPLLDGKAEMEELRAECTLVLANLLDLWGARVEAGLYVEESISSWRGLAPHPRLAKALTLRGHLLRGEGKVESARASLAEAGEVASRCRADRQQFATVAEWLEMEEEAGKRGEMERLSGCLGELALRLNDEKLRSLWVFRQYAAAVRWQENSLRQWSALREQLHLLSPRQQISALQWAADFHARRLEWEEAARLLRRAGELWASWAGHRPTRPAASLARLFELEHKEKALRREQAARREAEEANRNKDRFLANICHDIRTPMNGIMSVLHLLQRSGVSAEQAELCRIIQQSAETMHSLVNDILDFSKMEAGRLQLEMAPLDLRSLLEDVTELYSMMAALKGLSLLLEVDPGLPAQIVGDGLRLRQILSNLISNAVKFTTQGHVLLRADRVERNGQPPLLRLQVRDTGLGIDEEKARHLFTAYQQGGVSVAREYGGTGLGLAICRQLCELMGGQIEWARNEGPGTNFAVVIPLTGSPGAPGWTTHPTAGSGRKLLYVEDCPEARQSLLLLARAWQFSLKSVPSMEQAMEEALEQYDIILVDAHHLTNIMETARHCKARMHPSAKLYFLNWTDGYSIPLEARKNVGIHGVLLKPLTHRKLEPLVHACLHGQEVREESTSGRRRQGKSNTAATASEFRLQVLVAEDDGITQQVMALLFEKELGIKPVIVENGLLAVRMCQETAFDLIFMDVQMPLMDGLEATRRIRSQLAPERQPVIIGLTASTTAEDGERCRQAGMNEFLGKPVKLAELHRIWKKLDLV